MPYSKKIKIVTVLFLINLIVSPLTGNAQTATQTNNVQIALSDTVTVSVPSSLQMPSGFSFQNENNTVYAGFSPDNSANRIRVADTRNNGGFTLDLASTDFSDGKQTIPYQNIGIVTLSGTNNLLPVNWDGTTNPPGDDNGTITAPLHCEITEGQQGITKIESCENNSLQGFVNLSGIGNTSGPLLILDGLNPTTGGRIGTWYVGLGIRLTIPPGLGTNTYNSTITITLTPT